MFAPGAEGRFGRADHVAPSFPGWPASADDRGVRGNGDTFDARIEAVLAPFRDAAERLMSLPGISDVAAQVILAEIGTDMSSFPTAGHLLSWAGLTPRLDESAGKRRSTRLKKGAPWLKPALVQCAFAAARAKNTYLQAQFLRLKARRGPKKAAIAVAASILTAVYHMLRDGTSGFWRQVQQG